MSTQALAPYSAKFQTDVARLVDSLFDEFWRSPAFMFTRNWRPTDVKAFDDRYEIEIELPRVKKEDISVTATDANTLVITVKTKNGEFYREFAYGDANAENTKVALSDGVLAVTVPRVPPKLKKIEIQ